MGATNHSWRIQRGPFDLKGRRTIIRIKISQFTCRAPWWVFDMMAPSRKILSLSCTGGSNLLRTLLFKMPLNRNFTFWARILPFGFLCHTPFNQITKIHSNYFNSFVGLRYYINLYRGNYALKWNIFWRYSHI